MKLRTLCLLGLALAVCTDISALTRKKKQQDEPKQEVIRPVPADTFSYSMGVAQSEALKQYLQSREGIDTTYVSDAAKGILFYPMMSEADVKRQIAFVAGLRIGEMNRKQVLPTLNEQACGKADSAYVNEEIFNKGLVEGMLHTSTMSPEEAMQIAERQMKFVNQQLKNANLAWLENNKKQKGVKTTKSGLQYKVLSMGNGPVATDTSEVEVHYEGQLIDGKVFDSSYQRNQPTSFRCNQVIKGWTEALQLMPEGSVWELYIPYDLAYGERGNQGIPPFSTLIFKVELLKVKGTAPQK